MPPGTKSCGTCAHSDLAVRDDGPIRECHLLPPMTMPDPPPVEVDDDFTEQYGGVDVELPEFETPHRYPVVTDRDWCSHYKEES